ncbi:hypothetical protein BT93_L5880 [Corymbia citriodora subsp. variegata]|uniref:Uncharacterized protein n=1 Tax=Corymbia citriodora subsp. variegata TaxID=360336 RepID=A0A8T0CVA3_CORYI|nr:hypothetical protein BT93_L5880 [Corymbia citriodora subsp. variegata]
MLPPATSSIGTASDISLTSSSTGRGSLHVRWNQFLLSPRPCQRLPLLCFPSLLRPKERDRGKGKSKKGKEEVMKVWRKAREEGREEQGICKCEAHYRSKGRKKGSQSPEGDLRQVELLPLKVAIALLDGQGPLLLTLSKLLAWVVTNEGGSRRKDKERT